MLFSVHKGFAERVIDEKEKAVLRKVKKAWMAIAVLFLALAALACIENLILGAVLSSFILLSGMLALVCRNIDKREHGHLELGEKIYFSVRETGLANRRVKKEFAYSDVANLYVGDCPRLFFGAYSRYADQKKWRSWFGPYIVGGSADDEPLFACWYQEQALELLKEKCTRAKVMAEEEHQAYLAGLKHLEEQTMEQNHYEEIIEEMNGYIN